jgi:DNA replication protein DnaC
MTPPKETPESRLQAVLKELNLSTVRTCYGEEAEQSRKESESYEAFLLHVLEREHETRRVRRIEKSLRESKLPPEKTLVNFDRKRLPRKLDQQVAALLDGTFLDRRENVLAFGNPGGGKTHLLCAIGHELIHSGRRVLFAICALLVQQLLVAKRDLKLPKVLKRLSKYEAVILDDIGYVQQNREEMEILFTFLADRYERGSVMLTSNLPFSKWEVIFKDPMTTAAAIDRLVHHSVILELNLPSYRLEKAKKNKPQPHKSEGGGKAS